MTCECSLPMGEDEYICACGLYWIKQRISSNLSKWVVVERSR